MGNPDLKELQLLSMTSTLDFLNSFTSEFVFFDDLEEALLDSYTNMTVLAIEEAFNDQDSMPLLTIKQSKLNFQDALKTFTDKIILKNNLAVLKWMK